MAGRTQPRPEASTFRRQQYVSNLNNRDGFRKISKRKPSVSAVETIGFRLRNHWFPP